MDRDTKHFAIVAAIVGILLTLTMLYYANKSDKLVDDYAKGTLTLNLEKTGWEQVRDAKGNIIYKQKNAVEFLKVFLKKQEAINAKQHKHPQIPKDVRRNGDLPKVRVKKTRNVETEAGHERT